MKRIQSLLGRRQFLIAAGVTSTAALAFKKFGRMVDPVGRPGMAHAADAGGANKRYANLFSPLRIGNVVLKNRMYSTAAIPHNLQGPETFPAETSRFYAANLAKNGAAIVTCRIITNRVRKELSGDSAHMVIYDLEDYGVQNYLDQLVEGIHCYGSKATASINVTLPGQSGPGMPSGMTGGRGEMPEGGERGEGPPGEGMGMPGGGPEGMPAGDQAGGQQMMAMMASLSSPPQEISDEVAQQLIEDAVTEAKFYHTHGFDMVTMRVPNVVDRVKFGIDLYGAVKKACGQDFLIESPITVLDPSIDSSEAASAFTQDEAVALAKKWEDVVDILQIRVSGGTANHPDGYNQEKNNPLPLPFATAIKKSGAKTIAAPNGGFANHDFNEACVATGKLDLIAMGRPFIADWEYAQKAFDGRGEDVAPCIMCNKCHGTQSAPWISFCSVNPKMGIDSAVQAITAPTQSKKVAVIGGGPAGMKAAVVAAERGHQVTLYEKNDYLGGQQGQLVVASPFKWPVKDLMDYLALQMEKSGVDVKLGTAATPEMIGKKNYDALLVALGSDPVIPNIKGADGKNVYSVLDVFGKEKSLGKDVVFIGAGQYGMDVAIYLASLGINVTALTAGRSLIQPTGPHQLSSMIEMYQGMENFTAVTGAIPSRISGGKVTYTDSTGEEKSVKCDSVVLYSGLKARQAEAVAFGGLANQVHVIGECGGTNSGIQASQRSAFFAASQV